MKYLNRFVERYGAIQEPPSDFEFSSPEVPTKPTKPPAESSDPSSPDPLAHLWGPRRTPWGTWVWSDPAEPPIEAFVDVPPSTPPGGARRWRCEAPLCFKNGWWLSTQGVVQCLNCRPPSFPGLVVARGTEADAPEVLADRSTTLAATRDPFPEVQCPSC